MKNLKLCQHTTIPLADSAKQNNYQTATGKPVFSACSHAKYVMSRNSASRTGKERNSLMLSVKYWWNKATTSSKSTWDTVLYFALNGPSMILCLRSPLHPLSKLLVIQDHAQNFEEQLWMGRRREVSVTSHRPVTSCYLEQERSFFCWSVSTFAIGCSVGLFHF